MIALLALLLGLTGDVDVARVHWRPLAVAATPTPAPTPTPRPTTIVLQSANSSACGIDARYFGVANCNATYSAVDWTPVEDGTFTTMTCSQPTDSMCSILFSLYVNSGAPVSGFDCTSVDTAPCSPSSPPPTSFTAAGNLVAIRVDDVDETCGANAPTCVVEYTVP